MADSGGTVDEELVYLIDLKMQCGRQRALGLLDLLAAHDYVIVKASSQSGRAHGTDVR